MSSGKNFIALREGHSSDFHAQKSPKCPHCGQQFEIEAAEAWQLYTEGEHELTCIVCILPFTVTSVATFSFNTDEQEGMDDE